MDFYVNFKRKYFLTTSSFSNFKEGLRFYRPVNAVGFIKKGLIYIAYPFIKFCNNRIKKEDFFQRYKIEELLEWERNWGTFNAVYIPMGSGKFVIQVVKGSKVAGYLKFAVTDESAKALENEEKILKLLESETINSFCYPKILYSERFYGKKLLFLGAPEHLKSPIKINFKAILELWKNISEIESRTLLLEQIPYLKDLESKIKGNGNAPEIEISGIFDKIMRDLRGLEIKTGLVHGDFKIWNIFELKNDKFYVIDWEWAQRNSLPLWDLWTWAFWNYFSSGKKPNKNKLLERATEIAELSGNKMSVDIVKNLFKLYLIHLYTTLEEFGHKDGLTTKTLETLYSLLIELC